MDQSEYILTLVREAIHAIETNSSPVSAINQKCMRIARLRNDYINYWWLGLESFDFRNDNEKNRIYSEFLPHLTKEEYAYFNKKYIEAYIEERPMLSISENLEVKIDSLILLTLSIADLELEITKNEQLASQSQAPQGLHPVDLYFVDKAAKNERFITLTIAKHYNAILQRIKARMYDFLTQTEKQLLFGQFYSNIFEENRQYVELKLGQICPDGLVKFVSAYQRMTETDRESWAQALTSCRRLLKSLADVLYPPKDVPVIGADGKERILTDESYTSRLWQYIFEQTARSTSGELLLANVQDLGNRIDCLYDLTNKGVHTETNKLEVNQCVIQTYILLGDILRISENQTAMGVETA
jgi:hypothetical protein